MEIGCGVGSFCLWLANTFPAAQIFGVDFSTSAVALANESASGRDNRPNFLVCDATKLSFSNNRFDYVVSCECLEHVRVPLDMASEIHRVLE